MKYIISVFVSLVCFTSCAKIPVQSVNLIDALAEEGNRMHTINLVFLNGIFKAKKERIDEFIKTQYTPTFIAEFQKNIPKETDLRTELPGILKSIAPRIAERRDSMQSALEDQRTKLVSKLEQDYKAFESATSELRMLLVSASNINKETQGLFTKTKNLTKGAVDLSAVDSSIERFIVSGGKNLSSGLADLNNAINTIIKK